MKNIIVVIIGVILALLSTYFCGKILFIDGLIQGIEAIKLTPLDTINLVYGIVKVISASTVWVLSIYFIFIVGMFSLKCK